MIYVIAPMAVQVADKAQELDLVGFLLFYAFMLVPVIVSYLVVNTEWPWQKKKRDEALKRFKQDYNDQMAFLEETISSRR
jgi:hypothetical protein